MFSESSGSGEKAEYSDNSLDMFAEYSQPCEENSPDVNVHPDVNVQIEG
jgi:hypothetical protein